MICLALFFAGNIQLSVIAESSLGGELVAVSGPCFDDMNSTIICQFGDERTTGVIASPLRAYCVPPIMNHYGSIMLTVLVGDGTKFEKYTTAFTLCKYTTAFTIHYCYTASPYVSACRSFNLKRV